MVEAVDFPEETVDFSNDEEELTAKPKIPEDVLLVERQYHNLYEFLQAYINGDPIGQLFSKHDLTEKAQEELIKLQEAVTGKNISESKRQLESLKQELLTTKSRVNELRKSVSDLEGEQTKLSSDVEALKKRRRILTESLINDLDLIKSNLQEEYRDVSIEWRKGVSEWRSAWGYRDGVQIEDFDAWIQSYIDEYATSMNCSKEAATAQFYTLSPVIKEVSEYIKAHKKSLMSNYGSLKSWYTDSAKGSEEEKYAKMIEKILIPVYQIEKTR